MGCTLCDDWVLFVLLAPDSNGRLRQRRLCSCTENLRCPCALCVVHACVYRMHACIYLCVRLYPSLVLFLIAIWLFDTGR